MQLIMLILRLHEFLDQSYSISITVCQVTSLSGVRHRLAGLITVPLNYIYIQLRLIRTDVQGSEQEAASCSMTL